MAQRRFTRDAAMDDAPRYRFLAPLPITLPSRKGIPCTLDLQTEPCSGRRELTLREAGRCGYRIMHTFACWETPSVVLFSDGLTPRPGSIFSRLMLHLVARGQAERLPTVDSASAA